MAENPQGSRQGVGGGVESPQGNCAPGLTELPQADKTLQVTTAGGSKPRENGRGQGGDETPPTNRATGAQGNSGGDDGPMGRLRTAEPPCPQRDTAVDDGSM